MVVCSRCIDSRKCLNHCSIQRVTSPNAVGHETTHARGHENQKASWLVRRGLVG